MVLERELERMKEPDQHKLHDYKWNEDRVLHSNQRREMLARLPKVLKYDTIPWEQAWAANHKIYNSNEPAHAHKKLMPLESMTAREQILTPGSFNGQHRHFPEFLFFCLEGAGWEEHDGKRWPWSKWDAMCVPTYCLHQHFANSDTGARLFYVGTGLFEMLGLRFRSQQFKIDHRFEVPPGGEGIYDADNRLVGYKRLDGTTFNFVEALGNADSILQDKLNVSQADLEGKAETTYDEYVNKYKQEGAWRRDCAHVVKFADQPWEETRMGRQKYLIHPKVPSGLLTMDVWIQEIPPGGRSGKHIHAHEELHKILGGRGYSIIDDERHDWENEDVVGYPAFSVHQHFNASTTEPAYFVSVQPRLYDWINHGGYLHLEDAWAP